MKFVFIIKGKLIFDTIILNTDLTPLWEYFQKKNFVQKMFFYLKLQIFLKLFCFQFIGPKKLSLYYVVKNQ